MAARTGKVVALFAKVMFNAIDLSNYFNQAMLQIDRDVQEVTGFKSAVANRSREYDYGLDTIMFTGGVFIDYTATKSHATIEAQFAAATVGGTTMVCQPDFDTAASGVNPAYTFKVLVQTWTPLNTTLAAPMFTNVNWTVSGGYAATP